VFEITGYGEASIRVLPRLTLVAGLGVTNFELGGAGRAWLRYQEGFRSGGLAEAGEFVRQFVPTTCARSSRAAAGASLAKSESQPHRAAANPALKPGGKGLRPRPQQRAAAFRGAGKHQPR
jgi:hypothetical protein